MARVVTFGRHATTKPPGMLREIIWPQLALLDKGTNEGMINRILTSEGGDSRTLPRTWFSQFTQESGHTGSVVTGNVDEITLDGETGLVSGKGWALDDEHGRRAVLAGLAQALRHNSVDLAEVKVEWEEHGNFFDDDFTVDLKFVEWKFAATTSVGTPAFADAEFIVPDEIKAALYDDTPVVMPICDTVINIVVATTDEEITASAAGLPLWDYFHQPEPAEPHAKRIGERDERGFYPVCGHLALWNSCHDGIEARCIIPPRPQDNYASFNRFQVLTDRGFVETGPISLKGGHVSLEKALDDIDNAWADVRITPGVHGPWMSGYVRPGVTDEQVVAARASGVSGHWKRGELRAIVSVNTEGYHIPGTFSIGADDEVDELVASYPGCSQPLPDALLHMTPVPESKQREILKRFMESYAWTAPNGNTNSAMTGTVVVDTTANPVGLTVDTERGFALPNGETIILKGPPELLDEVKIIELAPDAEVVLQEEIVVEIVGVEDETDGPSDEDIALALELEG